VTRQFDGSRSNLRDVLGIALRVLERNLKVKLAGHSTYFLDDDVELEAGILLCPNHEMIEVRSSRLHGNGVFARRPIAQNEIVEITPSLLIMEKEIGRLFRDYQFSAASVHRSVLKIALGFGSIYNHNDKPNIVHRRVRASGCVPPQGYSTRYSASRDVSKDEELFIYYGSSWWESRGSSTGKDKPQHLVVPAPSARQLFLPAPFTRPGLGSRAYTTRGPQRLIRMQDAMVLPRRWCLMAASRCWMKYLKIR